VIDSFLSSFESFSKKSGHLPFENRKNTRPFWETRKVSKEQRGVNRANQGMNTGEQLTEALPCLPPQCILTWLMG